MEVTENGQKKASDICRICWRRGDMRLFELEGYLLDLFETITKIDVRSTVNFPSNTCHECINKLEDISLFIDMSKYNDSRLGNNIILKKENEYVAVADFETPSQELVVKTEKTTEEYEEDICTEKSEICRICLVPSCLIPFEEKAHLMQLFQTITNIDLEAASSFSSRNSICNKCINKLESISLFISSSLSNGVKIESTVGSYEYLKMENCFEENAKFNNIFDRKEVKVENYFNECVGSYENKDLLTVVDIKEEVLHSHDEQKGFESCSGTDSVEKLEGDPVEFSTKNHSKIISKGMEASLEAHLRMKQFKRDINLKNRFKRHSLINSKERPFKCYCCGMSFTQNCHRKRHMLTHIGEKLFRCDSCEKCFGRKNDLQEHMLAHTGEKPFKCDCCKKCFTSKRNLQQHMLTHTGGKIKCNICDKTFTQNCSLKKHMLIHTGEKAFRCDCCEKRFTLNSTLKQHMLTHTGEKRFQCYICEKCFSRAGDLKEHMHIHTEEKKFKCDCCGIGFSRESYLKQHIRTHIGGKPFKCDSCEKTFNRKQNLRTHMLTHTGEKRFKCDRCEKSFKHKPSLKEHMLAHTMEKPFKCECCQEGFTGQRRLQQHMLSHTGAKPFKCDICGKGFAHSNGLKRHMLIHNGEKSFKCDRCEKRFTLNTTLKRHVLTHTGEKPFECDSCEKCFNRKCHLKRHMLTHTE